MRKIQSLDDVHEFLPNGYHEVCIEISGYCNARCKYCPSGNQKKMGRKMMDVATFENILKKLISYKIIGKESQIDLFWWGEPFLNPHLNDIIKVTQKYGINYVISTNAAHYQKIEKENLTNLKRFIISMPGFSQRSYDRIHGFNFREIIENIEKYAKDLSERQVKNRIWIAYHIYQFNIGEIFDCYSFCYNRGLSFNPGFAFPLLADERVGYAKNNLPEERLKEICKDIVTDQIDRMIECSDKKNCIYQTRNFIIDEYGNVFACLNLRHESQYDCGNILYDDIDNILKRISELSICEQCISSGVAPTDMSFKFFYDDWFHMMKLREYYESRVDPIDTAKGKMLLCLRKAELVREELVERQIFSAVCKIMKEENVNKDEIDEMIQCYAMRSKILQEKFDRYFEETADE